jgi:hypothetical protein
LTDNATALLENRISRYIYDRHGFNLPEQRVTPKAFIINGKYPNELSVCITEGLAEEETWELALKLRQDRPLKARADLSIKQVESISNHQEGYLKVIRDDKPVFRHANIKHFPSDKQKQRAIALELAARATLQVKE